MFVVTAIVAATVFMQARISSKVLGFKSEFQLRRPGIHTFDDYWEISNASYETKTSLVDLLLFRRQIIVKYDANVQDSIGNHVFYHCESKFLINNFGKRRIKHQQDDYRTITTRDNKTDQPQSGLRSLWHINV